MSPIATWSRNVPQVPMRMNVVAPTRASSSSAIDVDGAPIPVEVHEIGAPSYVPGPGHVLAVGRHVARVVPEARDDLDAARVAGQEHDRRDVPLLERDVVLPCHHSLVERSAGKRITSRIVSLPESSMTRRSMPRPRPPVGGMP